MMFALARSGVVMGVYPLFATRFKAQLQRASSSWAASFLKKTNLFPVSLEAFWKSKRSNCWAISTWDLYCLLSFVFLGSLDLLSTIFITLFLSSPPTGLSKCVLLGNFNASVTSYDSKASTFFSLSCTSFFMHLPTLWCSSIFFSLFKSLSMVTIYFMAVLCEFLVFLAWSSSFF